MECCTCKNCWASRDEEVVIGRSAPALGFPSNDTEYSSEVVFSSVVIEMKPVNSTNSSQSFQSSSELSSSTESNIAESSLQPPNEPAECLNLMLSNSLPPDKKSPSATEYSPPPKAPSLRGIISKSGVKVEHSEVGGENAPSLNPENRRPFSTMSDAEKLSIRSSLQKILENFVRDIIRGLCCKTLDIVEDAEGLETEPKGSERESVLKMDAALEKLTKRPFVPGEGNTWMCDISNIKCIATREELIGKFPKLAGHSVNSLTGLELSSEDSKSIVIGFQKVSKSDTFKLCLRILLTSYDSDQKLRSRSQVVQ